MLAELAEMLLNLGEFSNETQQNVVAKHLCHPVTYSNKWVTLNLTWIVLCFLSRHPVSGVTALAHVDVAEESNMGPVVDRMRQLHSRIAENG